MSCFIDLLYYRCNNVEKKKQIFTCQLIIVFYSLELFYFTGHFFFGGGGPVIPMLHLIAALRSDKKIKRVPRNAMQYHVKLVKRVTTIVSTLMIFSILYILILKYHNSETISKGQILTLSTISVYFTT